LLVNRHIITIINKENNKVYNLVYNVIKNIGVSYFIIINYINKYKLLKYTSLKIRNKDSSIEE
jgi:hypothetical protein